jgi:hypothetical protein
MLADLISHVATHTGLPAGKAKAALGLVLDAADRQGAELSRHVFEAVPGARTLAAEMSAASGGTTGSIARLIERTPGGRVVVIEKLIRNLQAQGLGTAEIGALFPAIASFVDVELELGFGHLGDLFGSAAVEALAGQDGSQGMLQKITAR